MEIIALVLFVVFTLLSFNSKQKKQANRAQTGPQAKAAAARGASLAQSAVRPAVRPRREKTAGFEEALNELRRRLEEDPEANGGRGRAATAAAFTPTGEIEPAEGGAMLDDDECRGGSMAHTHAEGRSGLADEECYGGSMAHDHTEGVDRTAHARRMAAMDTDREAARPQDSLAGAIDAGALRRAVVMAEVLGKPRALQARPRR